MSNHARVFPGLSSMHAHTLKLPGITAQETTASFKNLLELKEKMATEVRLMCLHAD